MHLVALLISDGINYSHQHDVIYHWDLFQMSHGERKYGKGECRMDVYPHVILLVPKQPESVLVYCSTTWRMTGMRMFHRSHHDRLHLVNPIGQVRHASAI